MHTYLSKVQYDTLQTSNLYVWNSSIIPLFSLWYIYNIYIYIYIYIYTRNNLQIHRYFFFLSIFFLSTDCPYYFLFPCSSGAAGQLTGLKNKATIDQGISIWLNFIISNDIIEMLNGTMIYLNTVLLL